MWFDTEFDNMFRRLSNRFFSSDDSFETQNDGTQVQTYGPYYYGYELKMGPDGKPQVREWGNVRPKNSGITDTGTRSPTTDEIFDEKTRTLKLVAEMPGIEKSDIKVNVTENQVDLSAEHNDRKYHSVVPLKYKIDESSAKASYANGILEVTFNVPEDKPKGKSIPVN